MNDETHFGLRARQRAGIEDTEALYNDLRIALSDPERWSDYIEHVKRNTDGKDIWRVKANDRIFFVLAAGAFPVTVFTKEQVRSKKWKIKASRKRRRAA